MRPPSPARARPERVQHGRAGEGGPRRARHGVRALPLEARRARGVGGVDLALTHARHALDATSTIRSPRCATCWARCASTGTNVPTRCTSSGRSWRSPAPTRRLTASTTTISRSVVAGLASAGHLRPRWSPDDAVDALALLTSYPTYERLRGPTKRSPVQIEALLAKLAVSIVSQRRPCNQAQIRRPDVSVDHRGPGRVEPAPAPDNGLVKDAGGGLHEIGTRDAELLELAVERSHSLDQRHQRRAGRERRHLVDDPSRRPRASAIFAVRPAMNSLSVRCRTSRKRSSPSCAARLRVRRTARCRSQ